MAVASSHKLEAAGNVPTLAETYPRVFMDTWIGLAAPVGTPGAIIQKVNAAVNAAARRPEVQQAFQTVAIDLATSTPQEFDAMIKADQEKWPKLIRDAGIQPE